MAKKLLIASTSTVFGSGFLEYLLPQLKKHFEGCKTLLFIPYARPGGISHDAYTNKVGTVFNALNINVRGIHTYSNPVQAVAEADAIFTGGGNTFVLVNTLYQLELMRPLRDVLLSGTPYLGTSAGSNICGLTIHTTNDMPIIYPPSFKTLGVLPFNINPHYLDPIENDTHMGETRETRIKEFHAFNNVPVVGLREGSWLEVTDNTIRLKGKHTARVFEKDLLPYEVQSNTLLDLQ